MISDLAAPTAWSPARQSPLIGLPDSLALEPESAAVAWFQADGISQARAAALDWVRAHTDARLYPESQELVLGAGLAAGKPAYRLSDGSYVQCLTDDHAGHDENGFPNDQSVCWLLPVPAEKVKVHPHLIAFWEARGYPAAGPVNFDALPPAASITPPASGANRAVLSRWVRWGPKMKAATTARA